MGWTTTVEFEPREAARSGSGSKGGQEEGHDTTKSQANPGGLTSAQTARSGQRLNKNRKDTTLESTLSMVEEMKIRWKRPMDGCVTRGGEIPRALIWDADQGIIKAWVKWVIGQVFGA